VVARTFQRLIVVSGFFLLARGLTENPFRTGDVWQYAAYFMLAVLASTLRVRIRSDHGSMPFGLVFVMIAMVGLSTGQAMLLGAVAAMIDGLTLPQGENRWSRGLFNGGVVALAVAMCEPSLHHLAIQEEGLTGALALILGGGVFFLGITFPSALHESLLWKIPFHRIWKDRYFWSLPYYLAGMATAGLLQQANKAFNNRWQIPILVFPFIYLVYRSYRLYMNQLEGGRRHAEEMASLHLRTIEALALAIDAKDQTTHEHLQRVQIYAMEVGKDLGLHDEELEALRAASILHDIGKLAVPEHIISKPGRLTPEEFEKMKIHPVVGAEILERVKFPYPVVPIVRSHHERWDGNGYPDGLKAEEIPVGARILSAVDCLDALASDRQYRKALPLDQAIGVVVGDAGKAFDPRVVEVLSRRYVELERMAVAKSQAPFKLSVDLKIEAGKAPAAGFESSAAQPAESQQKPMEFLAKIAAARQEAQALFELAQNLGSSLSLDETLSVLAVRLKKLVPYDSLAVYIKREDKLLPEFVSGDNFRLFASLEIPMGQGLSGWVAENSKPILNGNPSVEPGYTNDPTKFSTLRSAVAVPLEAVSGVVGVLALYASERDAFTSDHLRILLAVSSKLAQAIENALRYRQAESSATTDFLTELPNARSLFLHLDSELARCRRNSQPLALFVCDLDNFKQINDQYGHLEGNKVLKIVGRALREHCREYDYIARMGGDEFVVVLPGLPKANVDQRIEQLRRATVTESRLQAGLEITLSVGAAMYPEDGRDAEELLAQADRAMYKAKETKSAPLPEKPGITVPAGWSGRSTLQ
jgi:diguanylate cyclase (GGDEF)-like protein/putative nucleotidyltransferase with HDIG domain